jgi:hypothetical protein
LATLDPGYFLNHQVDLKSSFLTTFVYMGYGLKGFLEGNFRYTLMLENPGALQYLPRFEKIFEQELKNLIDTELQNPSLSPSDFFEVLIDHKLSHEFGSLFAKNDPALKNTLLELLRQDFFKLIQMPESVILGPANLWAEQLAKKFHSHSKDDNFIQKNRHSFLNAAAFFKVVSG